MLEAARRKLEEDAAMNVYPIPDSLAHHYKGSDIALAAIAEGDVAALIYIRDLVPDFGDTVSAAWTDLAENPRVAEVARALETDFGHVVIAMVSGWVATEL